MNIHPLAQIIPPLTADEIERLDESLTHGFDPMNAIVLYEGMILDGRHRYASAKKAKVTPIFTDWQPAWEGDSAAQFVLRRIIQRALTKTQKTALAIPIMAEIEKEAAARKAAHQATGGKLPVTEKVPQPEGSVKSRNPTTTEIVAAACGTNRKYVEVAAKAKANNPDVYEKMKAGTISMADAKKAVAAPKRKAPTTIPQGPAVPAEAQAALDTRDAFKEAVNAIRACSKTVEELAKGPGGAELATRWRTIEAHLKNASEMVKFSTPHCTCPYMPNCEVGCQTCKGRKWVDRTIYDLLPAAIKDGVEVGK